MTAKSKIILTEGFTAVTIFKMTRKILITRDNNWLLSRLDELWSNYFPDISQDNPIVIKFGRFSKYRLGSIKLNRKTGFSQITITGMFKDLSIPQEVIDHTIAHEMVHYAHGFSSTKRKLHRYPHEGGVVSREMKQRSLEGLIISYKKWIKSYRKKLMAERGYG